MTGPARILTGDRINVIDSLRGFALAGIVLAHMIEHYTGALPPPELVASFEKGTLDQVIKSLMFTFVMGKFFAMWFSSVKHPSRVEFRSLIAGWLCLRSPQWICTTLA